MMPKWKSLLALPGATRKARLFIVLTAFVFLCLAVCAPFSLAGSQPQGSGGLGSEDPLWVTDGEVRALDYAGDTLYVAGSFNYVGPITGSGVPLDPSTGDPAASFPKVEGSVYCAAPDGAGGWYIGGDFTTVGGIARANLARIKADGNVDENFTPEANGRVFTLTLAGSILYVGGDFTSISGYPRNRIAALDATSGIPNTWNPGANDTVMKIVRTPARIYVAGTFTQIGGESRKYLAAFDADTGSIIAWNPNPDGAVWGIAIAGSVVYAGGEFTNIGGAQRNRIAAIDDTTGGALAWNPNADNIVASIIPAGSIVYVGGFFTEIAGVQRNRLAALDASTGQATAWNPNADNAVVAIADGSTVIYACGIFRMVGGQKRFAIAAIDKTTGSPTSWSPDADGAVITVSVGPSSIYAGGNFRSIGGEPRRNLAALNATTGRATAWNPEANSPVWDIKIDGENAYICGDFTQVNGQPRGRIAAVDKTTGTLKSWNPNANATVYSLAVGATAVYAGGIFTQMGSESRRCVAAVDKTTGDTLPWNPQASDWVLTVDLRGNTVYIGGYFIYVGTQTRTYAAAIDATTGLVKDWNPEPDDWVYEIKANDQEVYLGGMFKEVKGISRNRLACVDAETGNPLPWNPGANNTVFAFETVGNTVYAGGAFTVFGGESRNRIAAAGKTSGSPLPWNPSIDAEVFALKAGGGYLYVGGIFNSIDGIPRYKLARFALLTAPVVNSVVPESARVGENITIAGTGFGAAKGASFVSFGRVKALDYTTWTEAQIVCAVPAGAAGFAPVTVTTAAGESNPVDFRVIPEIQSVAPTNPRVGDEITIGGKAFGSTRGSSYVLFGAVPAASYTSWSDTTIKCRVPSGVSGQVTVSVTTDGGTSNGVVVSIVPNLTGISPTSAIVAGEVTLNGTAFGAVRDTSFVRFGGVQAIEYTLWSDTKIKCKVPPGAYGVCPVSVTTAGGTSNERSLRVLPIIASIYPDSGTTGLTVTITGDSFGPSRGASFVSFGGIKAETYVSWSNTRISCKVPAGISGKVPVYVRTSAGSSNTAFFSVLPEIASVSPPEGAITSPVIIKGSAFGSARGTSYVLFGSRRATNYSKWTDTEIICKVPSGVSGRVNIYVVTSGGKSNPVSFTVLEQPPPEARAFYFAEGTCRPGFDPYLCIQNPGVTKAQVRITYMLGDGTVKTQDIEVAPTSRKTVVVKDILGEGDTESFDFSCRVECTNGREIIAERPMYFNYKGAWTGGHNVVGYVMPR